MKDDQTIAVCANSGGSFTATRTIAGVGDTEEAAVADLLRKERESHRRQESAALSRGNLIDDDNLTGT